MQDIAADAPPSRSRWLYRFAAAWMVATHLLGFYLIGAGLSGYRGGPILNTNDPGVGAVLAGYAILVAGPAVPTLVMTSAAWAAVTVAYLVLPVTPVFWVLALLAARVVG